MGIMDFFRKSREEAENRRNEYKIESLKKLAESGDRESAYELGNCYYEGKFVACNPVEAVKWYTEAARYDVRRTDMKFLELNGKPSAWALAFEMLARFYRDGIGVQQNYLNALELFGTAFSCAADIKSSQKKEEIQFSIRIQGGELLKQFLENRNMLNPKESFLIGNICYYYGKRLLPDIITESNFVETAMSFLEKSYNNGYADAASRISHIVRYHHKKPIEALTILKEGAERGGFVSQHQLGDIYSIGEQDMGIEKNKDISIQWYKNVCSNKDVNFSDIHCIRDAADSIGLYYLSKNDLSAALDYCKIVVSAFQFANPFDYNNGAAYHTAGCIYRDIGDNENAKRMFTIGANYYGDLYCMEGLGMSREQIREEVRKMRGK